MSVRPAMSPSEIRAWCATHIDLVCEGCDAPRPWGRRVGECQPCGGVMRFSKGATERDQAAYRRWMAWLRSDDYVPLIDAAPEPKRRLRAVS